MRLNELVEVQIDEFPMNEMANLYPTKTGIGRVLWLGEVGGQHGPRIKVSNTPGKFNNSDYFVLTVDTDPQPVTFKSGSTNVKVSSKELDKIKSWVTKNHTVLIELWNIHETGDGDDQAILAKLEKV